MKKLIVICLLLMPIFKVQAQKEIPSEAIQVKGALLALPSEEKGAALVYGYNKEGELVVLRKGDGQMVCIADDPQKPGFSASCYHKDLEPFMVRGRELRAAGKTFDEVFKQREEEVKKGQLKMPERATLFVYYAPEGNFDPTSGTVTNGAFRYVVYLPYATAESTGLPLSPLVPGMPWLMDPGTHRAHIMITPPVEE